ncbi:MAG: hypothetical protein HGA80_03270 [Candidatus Omnitrophica bacterium]|nr:hypothetical protein [Candidatus Omnitrophota bacterium]
MMFRMRRQYWCWFLAAVLTAAYMPGLARAQAPLADDMRKLQRDEYGKRVLERNPDFAAPTGATPVNPYANESQQIAGQLQIISDNEDVNYFITQGDTLSIAFRDRDQTNRAAYKVSQAGEVFMPLVGPVKVAGLNRRQARESIDLMMKEYIREPKVVIAINTDGRVMIFGAVGAPGIYSMTSKMSVMEAILSAGSFLKQTAELASVIVIRGPVEKPVILKLNLKKMIARGDRTDDIAVKPGDFIYVPTTFISNLEKFWNTMYGHLMTWYGLGGNAPITGNNQWNWGH